VDVKAKEKSILSAIRSFVIVLALSIHAIFEGMAIGKLSLLNEDFKINRQKLALVYISGPWGNILILRHYLLDFTF
jgi:hypothetical protein